jgi:UDP-2,4-diacetamido-2,4,6-trideoxy-beta-L-altropyranose hydrolase
MLTEKGMEYLPLSIDDAKEVLDELAHASWLGTSQIRDAQSTLQALTDQSWDWIIVDHYALDERWESLVRESCKKLMVIDDLADRKHDCDVLLDQNYYSDMQTRYINKVPKHCQLFLGPRYALLREEFRVLREKIKVRTGDVKKILVFFGGVDADNFTSLAIQALSELNSKQQVDIVIGSQHPNREQIQQACINHSFICHIQTMLMPELMAEADLAIGGGGTAIWERCAMGLPSIIVVMAENQSKAAIDLNAFGVLISLGDAKKIRKVDMHSAVEKLLINEQLRTKLSIASMHLVPIQRQNKITEMLVRYHV